MKLNLKTLKRAAGQRLPFEETERWEQLEHKGRSLTYTRAVHLRGEASYRGDSVHVDVRLDTEIELECSRCLAPLPVTVGLKESFDLYEEPEGGFAGAPVEGFGVQHGTKELDLTPFLEKLIDSSLEPKPLCRPDCKGICPECGQDLNVSSCRCGERRPADPRLEKLKELLA